MRIKPLHILQADDDIDDILLFKYALKEIPIVSSLTTVRDGEELMAYLSENAARLPDVLFLDLSMPRKTGFECLAEIQADENLKQLPVIMFSTSFPRDTFYERGMINTLMKLGAQNYIRKPGDFTQLVEVIHQALIRLAEETGLVLPEEEL